jgi:hypothetical protein
MSMRGKGAQAEVVPSKAAVAACAAAPTCMHITTVGACIRILVLVLGLGIRSIECMGTWDMHTRGGWGQCRLREE